jgi:hypothetical protein
MRSHCQPVSKRRVILETLEQRRLLAGNVSVVAGENFSATITGDKRANSIEISLSGDQAYLIKGLSGTTVNGMAEILLRSPTAVNFSISMGKGDDSVALVGTLFTQSVSIDAGDGNDRVSISHVNHFGDLSITTGKGKDSVTLDNLKITRNFALDTGDDNDSILLAAVQVDGNAAVDAGRGKNTLIGADQISAAGSTSILGLNATTPQKSKKTKDKEDDKGDGDGHDKKHHESHGHEHDD